MGTEESLLHLELARSESEDACSCMASNHTSEKPDGEKEEMRDVHILALQRQVSVPRHFHGSLHQRDCGLEHLQQAHQRPSHASLSQQYHKQTV